MRDFFWIATGRFITAIIGLWSIRLATEFLLPAEYGILAMLIAFQGFCGLFLINPVGQYINRHTHEWADDGTLLGRLRRYRIWVQVSAIIGAIVSGSWAQEQSMSSSYSWLIMGLVMFMVVAATWNATSVSLLNMLGNRAHSVSFNVLTAFLSLLLSFILTSMFDSGIAWFGGQAVGMAIGAFFAGRAIRFAYPESSKAGTHLLNTQALTRYILPLAVATGLMWWLISGPRLLFEAYWGLAALGYVAVGLNVSAQLWGLVESLSMQFLFPLFFRRIATTDSADNLNAFSDLVNTLGPIYLVLGGATLVGAPSLIRVLVDVQYLDALPFVLFGMVIELCRAFTSVLAAGAQIDRKMSVMILPYAVGAIAMTLGILWFAYHDKSITEAVGMLALAGSCTLFVMAVSICRLHTVRLDLLRWGIGVLILVISACVAMGMGVNPSGLSDALIILLSLGVAVIGTVSMLLLKNPGAARLLAVRLVKISAEGSDK